MAERKKVVVTSEGVELDYAALQSLGYEMKRMFARYTKSRRTQETQWLKNLYQFLGKYDPEIDQTLPPSRSRAYPKITRTKLMTIVARLMNLLFPQGDKSWGVSAPKVPNVSQEELDLMFSEWLEENPDGVVTQEELDAVVREFARKAAANMETHIEAQLSDSMGSETEVDSDDFVSLCRRVIISGALYNVGVLKGPMTVAFQQSRAVVVPGARPVVETVDGYRPYFEFVDVWSYYPDLEAKTFAQMDGEFEEHVYSKLQLQKLADRADFYGDEIRQYITENPDGDYTVQPYETDLDTLNESKSDSKRRSKYRLVEYWGVVETKRLRAIGLPLSDDPAPDDEEQEAAPTTKAEEAGFEGVTRVTLWMAGDRVAKLELNPLPPHAKLYHHFVFDDSVPSLLGGSLCEIVRDSQMAVSSSARMMIDNASVTCGPNLEIDLSKLVDGQDTGTIGPFRNYYTDQRSNPGGHRAVQSISFDSHLGDLLSMQNQFLRFADTETFVTEESLPEATPGEALRTTGGASMVLGNAALPFRDIVRSFDRFTVSVINSMVAWNRIFNDELDVVGDLRPVAKGATSLIAKEVRALHLDNLVASLTEEERLYIDDEKLILQRLHSRDLLPDDVFASEAEVKRRKEARDQQQQVEMQRQEALFQAQLKELHGEHMKDLAQAKKNLDTADQAAARTVKEMVKAGAEADARAR